MIDKSYGEFTPVCDGCSDTLDPCDSFYAAVDAAKEAEWSYDHRYGTNLCPKCQKEV